jgi:Tfp pilus assembly protein PilP
VAETPPQPEDLSPDELMARYAATGIWPLAPEPPAQADTTDIDEFYLTSLDETVNFQDAVALPPAPDSARDRRPETPPAPAPPGTQFTLDARGLVLATPEGALTPDGVLVRSGPPPVRPPETRLTPPAEPAPAPSSESTAETTAEDARLGGIRPRTRPENLIEQQERGALSGLTRSELASLRPRLRPQAVIEAAAAAAAPPPAPEVQPADVSSASLAAALIEANRGSVAESLPQAVGTSIKPKLRPQELEQAARAPQPDRATPNRAEPGEDEEPEIQTAARRAPNIPTTASVARSATETNAINLRNVNLIGVYGSPQSRRALVRLSNGRYQKVKVGDRLDGGQVLAIGDAELHYNKRGRDVVLRMPKG